MRIESPFPLKNGGWLHKDLGALRSATRPAHSRERLIHAPERVPNFDSILEKWRKDNGQYLGTHAARLGVRKDRLAMLGAAPKDSTVLGFPMSDHNGVTIGVRLRNETGHKWAVKGSRQGLFVPFGAFGLIPKNPCLVCEGPTDTAAALDAGFFAIGRPACLGQETMLRDCLANLGIKEVILCADQDEPGQRGAAKLVKAIGTKIKFRQLTLQFSKDLRAWINNFPTGSRHRMLEFLLQQTWAV